MGGWLQSPLARRRSNPRSWPPTTHKTCSSSSSSRRRNPPPPRTHTPLCPPPLRPERQERLELGLHLGGGLWPAQKVAHKVRQLRVCWGGWGGRWARARSVGGGGGAATRPACPTPPHTHIHPPTTHTSSKSVVTLRMAALSGEDGVGAMVMPRHTTRPQEDSIEAALLLTVAGVYPSPIRVTASSRAARQGAVSARKSRMPAARLNALAPQASPLPPARVGGVYTRCTGRCRAGGRLWAVAGGGAQRWRATRCLGTDRAHRPVRGSARGGGRGGRRSGWLENKGPAGAAEVGKSASPPREASFAPCLVQAPPLAAAAAVGRGGELAPRLLGRRASPSPRLPGPLRATPPPTTTPHTLASTHAGRRGCWRRGAPAAARRPSRVVAAAPTGVRPPRRPAAGRSHARHRSDLVCSLPLPPFRWVGGRVGGGPRCVSEWRVHTSPPPPSLATLTHLSHETRPPTHSPPRWLRAGSWPATSAPSPPPPPRDGW